MFILFTFQDCPQFWPDAGTNEYGPFTVSLMGKESTPDFEMRQLQLVYTKRVCTIIVIVNKLSFNVFGD